MTWTSTSAHAGRPLRISAFPRNGMTTLRISDSLKGTMGGLYGGIGGAGMGAGAMAFGVSMATIHHVPRFIVERSAPFRVGLHEVIRSDQTLHVVVGLGLWATSVVVALLIGRRAANVASRSRQSTLKALLERLAGQALDSIRANR